MKKFKVEWIDKVVYNCKTIIEANDEEQAVEIAKSLGESHRFEEVDAETGEFEAKEVTHG